MAAMKKLIDTKFSSLICTLGRGGKKTPEMVIDVIATTTRKNKQAQTQSNKNNNHCL
jgi:hypothetical protein